MTNEKMATEKSLSASLDFSRRHLLVKRLRLLIVGIIDCPIKMWIAGEAGPKLDHRLALELKVKMND